MAQSSNLQREPSMEEILASIRRIIEDSDTTRKAPDEEAAAARNAAEPVEASNIHAFRLGLHEEADDPAPPRAEAAPVTGYEPATGYSASDDVEAVRSEPEAPARDEIEMELSLDDFPEETVKSAQESAEPGAATPAALVSDHAGRQVAASFGELSAAFEARSRRSFDQIAEEMMRPMLQDWLDNNLPHLVERLVREEIERIARGAAAPR